ncbi:hypothetical protein [Mycobacterium vicinigordonae]|uniref:Uncharacterized protein n=1 Tax=Mycobacterium vicinigordonae TaxID=1719132 RepID=A0A7D6E0K9_9MYCO|nr:hypothetical protein [Mycobacterium vicinigordonae]QLL05586.1 hypothetical protein H0P51_17270 [Mycobacterium vicinigordonae]
MTITTTAVLTDDDIEHAILNALAATNEELVSWAALRRHLPGSYWAKAGALDRLWIDGKVYVVRVRGRNYVGLGDELDAQMAAKAKAEGRVRELTIL